MNLRPASAADFAALARLHKASFAKPWDEQALRGLAASGAVATLAEHCAKIEGFILTRAAADEAEILTLAVGPEARRAGFGRVLVVEAARLAAKAGTLRMFLEVAAGNGPARGLYASLGFVEVGQRKGYYPAPGRPPEDALILAAALPLSGLGNGVGVD